MTVLGHAYPWDVLGDPGFVSRVRDLGLDGVNLAAAYHTTRAATPWHPGHALVDAAHAAFYRPIRPEAWPSSLRPAAPGWMPSADSFGEAARILADAGIPVHAWIVLTHSSVLGASHPQFAVRNCFGDPYQYALCITHPQVRDYAARLVSETVRDVPLAGVCLEACGQLGFDHGGHHDKTDGAYTPLQRRWLSVCCCPACPGSRHAGELRRAVREGVDPSGLGSEILAVRQEAADALRRAAAAAAGGLRVTLHGDPDPWTTGALPGLTPKAGQDVDAVVVQCWRLGEESVRKVPAAREVVGGGTSVGGYVTVLPPSPATGVTDHVRALARAGADELHLYHLGLAGPERFGALADAVTTFRESR